AIHKPLEAYRHLVELAAELSRNEIDHPAAYQSLADRHIVAPFRPMLEQVENCDRKVVVRIQQTGLARYDAVPIGVGIASEGDIEAILEADQALHRVGRGWVHANLAVPIDRHEAERRIDDIVHDRKIQSIALGNRTPIVNFGATKRIHAHFQIRAANRIHVEHAAEIAYVRIEIVMAVSGS